MTLVMNISCTGSPQTKRMVIHEGESICIGRSNSEASLIVDARLSRSHFNLHYGGGQIRIEHLSSTNPTVVASQGSSDFQKVVGERVESQGCRIIAGSHRFVLSVAALDSAVTDGIEHDLTEESVEEVNSKFWSDVDPEPKEKLTGDEIQSGSEPIVEEQPETQDSPAVGLAREQPTFIDVDDSYFAPPAKPQAPARKKKQPPVEKPTKKQPSESEPEKPVFPITDDFFDD